MRIEPKGNDMYCKSPDRIDAYLIRIVNRYFNSTLEDIDQSRESIITEAVNRIKLELLSLSANGVIIPVTSVNGKTGPVSLTYTDLGAEPAFEKLSAFNRSFGNTAGTVTEGNDPRLSDARVPKSHTHTAGEITNLREIIEGILNERGI